MNLTFWIIFLGMSVGGPLLAMIGGTWLGNKYEDRRETKAMLRFVETITTPTTPNIDHWAANNYR